jgi:hypothetical protein
MPSASTTPSREEESMRASASFCYFCISMNSRSIFFIFALFPAFSAFGQIGTTSDTARMDSLFFLNGEIRAVKVVDTVANIVRFLPQKRKGRVRVQEVEISKIFSLKFSNDQERIMYFQDSALGNVFSVLEAKMFMLGEQEAEKNYHNKWPFIIGFTAGSVSPLVLSNAVLLSPIPAAVTPLHILLPNIHVNTKKIINKTYLQYDTYLMGYVKVARKKNFIHALIGAGTGLAVGFGTWLMLK